jgi:hypothetical protein
VRCHADLHLLIILLKDNPCRQLLHALTSSMAVVCGAGGECGNSSLQVGVLSWGLSRWRADSADCAEVRLERLLRDIAGVLRHRGAAAAANDQSQEPGAAGVSTVASLLVTSWIAHGFVCLVYGRRVQLTAARFETRLVRWVDDLRAIVHVMNLMVLSLNVC